MKLKEGFVTHEMGGEQVMVATGNAKFAGLARSNPTAAFIVDCLKEETSKEAIVAKMLDKYEVSESVAANDVDKILGILRSIEALDE